jgi:glycosyltransferase involved in cell wall biosynthesis
MTIDLVFITYNRLEYTKLALASLLADPTEQFSLTIWDNGSTDGTKDYLSSMNDPRIKRRVFMQENVGLQGAVNDLFSKSSANLVGIVPNDFLFTPGWTRPLAQAHADVPELGMIGCWHLGEEFFDESRAINKIQTFGRHRVFRHPWTGGGAGLVKLKAVRECGPLRSSSTPDYWKQMATRGYVNGFYYPLICVEHMDYPWSEHYAFSGKLQEGIEMSVTYRNRGIRTIDEARVWHQSIVRDILDGPWDVKYYVGWRGKLRRIKKKVKRIVKSI